MNNEEKLNRTFNNYLESCSIQQLASLLSNELEDFEMIEILNNRNEYFKQDVLEQKGIRIE